MLNDPRQRPLQPGGFYPAPPIDPAQVAATAGGALGIPPQFPPPGQDLGDPILSGMLSQGQQDPVDPTLLLPDEQQPGYVPKMEDDVWLEVANQDQERHRRLLRRYSRDVMLYRQRKSAKPPNFDPKVEVAFQSATISNIVNKLTNMSAPMGEETSYAIPYKDETSKQASQVMENAYYYWRECQEAEYVESGGGSSLAWDEFFYNYLFGRICCRILPNPRKPHFPFDYTLLDPATVFPVFVPGEGLVRITHRRNMKAIDVLAAYLPGDVNLTQRIQSAVGDKYGFDSQEYRRFFYVERELIEGFDSWNQWASWGGITLYNKPHKIGVPPFVYVTAKGEPHGMLTPEGRYWDDAILEDADPDLYWPITEQHDLAEKGVSVFHHIIRTNRLSEIVYTLLLTEVMKASNPSTITYSAPQMTGVQPQPLRTKPGGNNQRTLNAQRVEIVPTSPHPTDVSPVLSKVTGDTVEGSMNPAAFGNVEGSNIAGYAIESMIAATKDTVLPYLKGYELYRSQSAKLMALLYRKFIMPVGLSPVPMDPYGNEATKDLTPEVMRLAGFKAPRCEIISVSDQQRPMLINTLGVEVERGFSSRRFAMEKIGHRDPDKMLQQIIVERALEHPEMMENFLIPVNFIRAGQKDLADLWVLMVVMPKIQALMMKMLGPLAQGPMAGAQASGAAGGMMGMLGGGAGPSQAGAPQLNGQSNPMAARAQGPPTGPRPGQGRGPAPTPALAAGG